MSNKDDSANYMIYPGWTYNAPISEPVQMRVGDRVKLKGNNVHGRISQWDPNSGTYTVDFEDTIFGSGYYTSDDLIRVEAASRWMPNCECGTAKVMGDEYPYHSPKCPRFKEDL